MVHEAKSAAEKKEYSGICHLNLEDLVSLVARTESKLRLNTVARQVVLRNMRNRPILLFT